MNYSEKIDNLFNYEKTHLLAHCISADSAKNQRAMGAGIVVEFNRRYNMKQLIRNYGLSNEINVGDAIVIGKVVNLITKPVYYLKPTYDTFKAAIISMKEYCIKNNITKLAFPILGCGIDRLDWNNVRDIIKDQFKEIDVDILVCFYNQTEWDKWH